MTKEVDTVRAVVSKFGARGAHVIVPSSWVGSEVVIVRVERAVSARKQKVHTKH